MTQPTPTERHLEVEEVVGYLEDSLDPAARQRVQAHLADCSECAAELVAVSRLRRPSGRPMARWLAAGAAAAAVITLAVVGSLTVRKGPPDTDTTAVRGAAAVKVRVVSPTEGASVSGPPHFIWRSVPGATTYRIAVSRSDGDSVWAATVRDTTAHPPASVSFGGSEPYYWYVDVLLADGRSIAGSAHEFRTQP